RSLRRRDQRRHGPALGAASIERLNLSRFRVGVGLIGRGDATRGLHRACRIAGVEIPPGALIPRGSEPRRGLGEIDPEEYVELVLFPPTPSFSLERPRKWNRRRRLTP